MQSTSSCQPDTACPTRNHCRRPGEVRQCHIIQLLSFSFAPVVAAPADTVPVAAHIVVAALDTPAHLLDRSPLDVAPLDTPAGRAGAGTAAGRADTLVDQAGTAADKTAAVVGLPSSPPQTTPYPIAPQELV